MYPPKSNQQQPFYFVFAATGSLNPSIAEMDTEAANTEHATDLTAGPFSVLYQAVRTHTPVLINVRNNHKLLGRVKAYDRHMNLYVLRVV
jgi:LSM domain